MKNPIPCLLLVAGVFCWSAVPQNVFAQDQPANQPSIQTDQNERNSGQVVTGLMHEGELRSVDPDKSIFLVVGAGGNEVLFHYDDQTEVVGASSGVQGLTGQSGTWLKIEYRAEGEKAIAEKIELAERDAGAGEAPSPANEPEPPANEPYPSPGL
jgi:hypothetical protein